MKKSSTLAQQVMKAQQAMKEWPDSIRTGLKLENSVGFISASVDEKKESGMNTKSRGGK
ncbi:hypothetical protein [Pseudomonas corrugata]|jgi:hypothetical protein|uniref:hypothetical protein n=1 Tax=Pseudomonas corrugata TaxID=47879 RepID=UPI0015867B07|nr:hypothetical protein [Pseudomonas corrugata]MCI0992381.1 hypothetical protein [Pseudomonas corrugata]NUT65789.1 hypothetical protein [Pseudomonas corrugata]